MGVCSDQIDASELFALRDCDDRLDRNGVSISASQNRDERRGRCQSAYRSHGNGFVVRAL